MYSVMLLKRETQKTLNRVDIEAYYRKRQVMSLQEHFAARLAMQKLRAFRN